MIEKEILIEDLVSGVPKSVGYLMRKGIKCLACGEPVWGTLEEAARKKGFSDDEIAAFVRDLNALAESGGDAEPAKEG
jgi:methionine synthase II (cobalamin-independent)